MKCFHDFNKWKSVCAKSRNYGGYGRSFHSNEFISGLFYRVCLGMIVDAVSYYLTHNLTHG